MTFEVKPYRDKKSGEITWRTELRIRHEYISKNEVRNVLANWTTWQDELVELPAEEVADAIRKELRLDGANKFDPMWEDDKAINWTWVDNHLAKVWKETF